jgi:hypothetical protein
MSLSRREEVEEGRAGREREEASVLAALAGGRPLCDLDGATERDGGVASTISRSSDSVGEGVG